MAVSALIVAGATAGSAAYSADQQKKGAKEKAEADRVAADLKAKQDLKIAEDQRLAVEKSEKEAKEAEALRDAERRRQQADSANADLAVKEPTVQLGQGGSPTDDTQRKRRAAFRPEYASGITI